MFSLYSHVNQKDSPYGDGDSCVVKYLSEFSVLDR